VTALAFLKWRPLTRRQARRWAWGAGRAGYRSGHARWNGAGVAAFIAGGLGLACAVHRVRWRLGPAGYQ